VIEPTDEMLWAALDAYDQYCPEQRSEDGFRLALAAVLAIVERDYRRQSQPKGWLIEHVDHHGAAAVEGCTFCGGPTP
jgi:hypothetical protein